MTYYLAREYTDTPGGRFVSDGPFSGEDFRNTVLKEKLKLLQRDEKLHIVFDGAYGYPTSFLEEAFGGLAREIGCKVVLEKITFESNDEPDVVSKIMEYIKGDNDV
jgi:hypothetical protein